MPMFTNNSKIAAKQIDNGLVQLGVAITLEAAYEDSQWGDDPFDGSREDYVENLRNEPEDSDDAAESLEGYEQWREEHYESSEWYNDFNNPASHYHY